MPAPRVDMDLSTIAAALAALGDRLPPALGEVELLLVGGAAGLLTGLLEPERTTVDCDVILYHPADARVTLEAVAEALTAEHDLPPGWLNAGAAAWVEALPPDWTTRRVLAGRFGSLSVYAIGRLDLLAMKLIAGREQDVDDLLAMKITADEATWLRGYLDSWPHDHWPTGYITEAAELLALLTRDDRDGL